MDVGFYLGELLMQQGEVSVPGLGYFVQVRVSGYYDEAARKFHPPYHQAQFDVQSIDDDALAEYIAQKKNISVASAKYFAEKYITNLKQQALLGEVPIGNLGWFHTELTQLTFKPADKIIDDTIFYGFEPISINKIGDVKAVEERPKVELNFPPKFTPPKPAVTEDLPEEISAEPVQTIQPASVYDEEQTGISPEFFEPNGEEEEETRGPLRLLLIILIAIVVIGAGIFALYRYKPDTFARMAFWQHETKVVDSIKTKPIIAAKPDSVLVDTTRADSAKKDTVQVKKDTVAKPAPKKTATIIVQPVAKPAPKKTETIISQQPVAQPKKKEIIVSQQPATITNNAVPAATKPKVTKLKAVPADKTMSAMDKLEDKTRLVAPPSTAVGTRRFEVYAATCNTVAEANAEIRKMRKAGFDPRIVTDGPGPEIHISIGHFATKQEATDLAMKGIESGAMQGGTAYGIEIIPQK